MNEARANRILAALKEQGVDQMLITDPMSICYLTGISMAPIERFYALLLKADGHHYYFLNHLFNVPGDVGVEKYGIPTQIRSRRSLLPIWTKMRFLAWIKT